MIKFQALSVVVWCCVGQLALAQAPVAVETVAPLDDIVFEVKTQVEVLSKSLEDSDGYEENRPKQIRQSFGLLACLGQALAEHQDASESTIQGAALRDAALMFKKDSSLDDAKAAFEKVKLAQAGKATGEAAKLHPWNKLINMHPMMEEVNSRNGAILKVLRRPRGKEGEPVHATTWAILGLAMKADTHEVKNEADLPKWHKHADDFIHASTKLAEAIRAKDKTEGRKWFDAANNSCDACHEVFQ
ncbi:hypothetical protein [Thalassoglobus sp.]|uniref:hypothetical protein n=1 Tax=Thalassoglobus sp. TaxID=2795869 RepID=UPI003AA8823C